MSLNQSINKIAPYVTHPNAKQSSETGAVPFSPSFVQAKDQSYKQGEDDGTSRERKKADQGSDEAEYAFPEIFKVTDAPDFSDLFLLAAGKDESKLMLVIKKVRKNRGVTELIPVSDIKKKKANQPESNTYLKTHKYFTNSKGEQFTGEI